MYIRPHTLSLITTHQCTAACSHCCFDCTPKITKHIPISRLFSLISEAKDIPSIKVVVFTGGECFLLKQNLDNLIKHASELKFLVRCVTNGYWAATYDVAVERLLKLKTFGLTEINFSTGSFHSLYVKKEKISNGVLASCYLGIKTVLNIEIFKDSDFDVDFFLNNTKMIEYIKSGVLIVQRNIWMQNNGNLPFENLPEHSRFLSKNKTSCTSVLKVITVNPEEELIACCGLHLEKIKDLHIGSVKNRKIKDVLNDQRPDLIKMWLHTEGPEAILEFVKKHDPNFVLPLSSSHICETCLFLFKNKKAQEIITNNFSEIEEIVLNKYYSSIFSDYINNKELNI